MRYESEDGSPIALLKSDFSSSLTVPDHSIEDLRSGAIEGLRRENGKIVLFDKLKDKPEKTRVLEKIVIYFGLTQCCCCPFMEQNS
ncbi:MAG: hypothetical protein V4596_12140 [Bdellovibrionota bacterium]